MRSRTLNHYCPECKQKKLSHRQYRSTGKTFWQCFNRDCDLTIEHEDRNAEISDYYSPLDKMSRLNPEERITDYFLQNERNVYQKGFEILFTGERLFVVRHKHKTYGVCVALYWNGDTVNKGDEDVRSPHLDRHLFEHSAASHLEYQGKPVIGVISHYPPQLLWRTGGLNQRFQGRLVKSLKAQIVEWASGLDAALPGLIEEAKSLVASWKTEHNELAEYLKARDVTLVRFNQRKKKSAEVRFRMLSIEECYRLDKILPKKLKIKLVKGVDYLTTEQAESVVDLLGVEDLEVQAIADYQMTPKLAKKAADALDKAGV